MISNERPSFGNSYLHGGHPSTPRIETTIKSAKIQIERKTFIFSLKENPRGRFLRITEDVGGRHDTIIIPAPGLEDFRKVLDEILEAADSQSPVPQEPPPEE
jgi:hypothetical protein